MVDTLMAKASREPDRKAGKKLRHNLFFLGGKKGCLRSREGSGFYLIFGNFSINLMHLGVYRSHLNPFHFLLPVSSPSFESLASLHLRKNLSQSLKVNNQHMSENIRGSHCNIATAPLFSSDLINKDIPFPS